MSTLEAVALARKHYPELTLVRRLDTLLDTLDTLDPQRMQALTSGSVDRQVYATLAQALDWTGYVLGYEAATHTTLSHYLRRALPPLRAEQATPPWVVAYLLLARAEQQKLAAPGMRRDADGRFTKLAKVSAETLLRTPWYLFAASPGYALLKLQPVSRESMPLLRAVERSYRYSHALGLSPLRQGETLTPQGEQHEWMQAHPLAATARADGPASGAGVTPTTWGAGRYQPAPLYALPARLPVCAAPGCETRLWHRRSEHAIHVDDDPQQMASNSICGPYPVDICLDARATLAPPDAPRVWLTPPPVGEKHAPFSLGRRQTADEMQSGLYVCPLCARLICSQHMLAFEAPLRLLLSAQHDAFLRFTPSQETSRGALLRALRNYVSGETLRLSREQYYRDHGTNPSEDKAYDLPSETLFKLSVCLGCLMGLPLELTGKLNMTPLPAHAPVEADPDPSAWAPGYAATRSAAYVRRSR